MTRICVAGGDGRMDHAARALQKEGFEVIRAAEMLPDGTDALVLPIHKDTDGAYVSGTRITQERIKAMMAEGSCVIGGMLPVHGERVFDYMKNEAFLYENARITAEGAAVLLAGHLSGTLYGTDIAVIGMGRIAECLCLVLHALGARVTVYARRQEVLARARAMGAETVCFSGVLSMDVVTAHQAVCNTVPHVLFDDVLLSHARRDVLLLELASTPGGFDRCAAKHYGLQLINGQGLPGKYAPRTAGELIAAYTLDVLRGEIT
ncbi:MAG: hypothetical protein IJW70_09350 [Clostridia bacterium]|nr:hypothetical protein [Clostridia bacterium]